MRARKESQAFPFAQMILSQTQHPKPNKASRTRWH